MPLREQLAAASTKLRSDFEQRTAAFGQNLDKGEAREAALRETLVRWLPRRHSLGRGEIVDATAGRSNQIDIVIYDELNSPLIFSERDSPAIFPVESVYGFAEVKSRVSERELIDGWNKGLSVYGLQRQLFEHSLGGALTVSGAYKPFSALFAFTAPKNIDDLTRLWGELASIHPPTHRLNMVCILGIGCLMYVSSTNVWSLGNFPEDVPTFVQTGDDSLLMFMLCAWTAMGEAPSLSIPNPIAYAGGALKYDVKMFRLPKEPGTNR